MAEQAVYSTTKLTTIRLKLQAENYLKDWPLDITTKVFWSYLVLQYCKLVRLSLLAIYGLV